MDTMPAASDTPKPRRPDKRVRGRTVACRPTPAQLAEIEQRAAAAGMTPGGYVLHAALAGSGLAPRRRAPALDAASIAVLRTLMGAVGKLGNGINQLVRAVYLGQRRDGSEVGPALLAEVQALAHDIRTALRVCAGQVPDDR